MIKDINSNKYDLEERTAVFAENVVELCKKIQKSVVVTPIIDQLVRSGTSIGANYCEANGASSKKDFKNKIHICKKESKETMYWLRIIAKADESNKEAYRVLWQEAHQLAKIFATIASRTNNL